MADKTQDTPTTPEAPVADNIDSAISGNFEAIRAKYGDGSDEPVDGTDEGEVVAETADPESDDSPAEEETSEEAPESDGDEAKTEGDPEGEAPEVEAEAKETADEPTKIKIGEKEYPADHVKELVENAEQLVGFRDQLENQRAQFDQAMQNFQAERRQWEEQRTQEESRRNADSSAMEFIQWQEQEHSEGRLGSFQEFVREQQNRASQEQSGDRPLTRAELLRVLDEREQQKTQARQQQERQTRIRETESNIDSWVPSIVGEALGGKVDGEDLLDHSAAVANRIGRELKMRGITQDRFLSANPDEIKQFIKGVASRYAASKSKRRTSDFAQQVEDAVNGKKPLPATPATTSAARAPSQPKAFRIPKASETAGGMDSYFDTVFSGLREKVDNLDREARDF